MRTQRRRPPAPATRVDAGRVARLLRLGALLLAPALVCAPLMFAGEQLTGFPFQNETLRYNIKWPGGSNLGDATLTAHKAENAGWEFADVMPAVHEFAE